MANNSAAVPDYGEVQQTYLHAKPGNFPCRITAVHPNDRTPAHTVGQVVSLARLPGEVWWFIGGTSFPVSPISIWRYGTYCTLTPLSPEEEAAWRLGGK